MLQVLPQVPRAHRMLLHKTSNRPDVQNNNFTRILVHDVVHGNEGRDLRRQLTRHLRRALPPAVHVDEPRELAVVLIKVQTSTYTTYIFTVVAKVHLFIRLYRASIRIRTRSARRVPTLLRRGVDPNAVPVALRRATVPSWRAE